MSTKEQALTECLSVVNNKLAAQVLVDKYLLTDNNKNYLETTPQQMWKRHAYAISQVEKNPEQWENKFNNLLQDFKFVPAGRVLYGLGNKNVNVTLKNCYVIAIREDSIKGIFNAAYEIAETLKAGGGVGIDISALRPKGMLVKNAARESTGAVSFMDFYSHITGMIGQKARIGAMLISISVDHPDIEDFITIKGGDNLNLVRNANVSVRITDEFMQAVTDNTNFDLKWEGKVFKTIKARELWKTIINRAWKRGEPGLLFWNTIRREGPAEYYNKFISICTNPCGEVALSDGDSCNLASINLGKYVNNSFTEKTQFDYDQFEKDVRLGVRFLDNIITLEKCPLEFQQWANDNGRRLGLGVMGLADVFMKMRIKYDTDEALALTDHIMNRFKIASYDESCELAIERGPFPVFEADKHLRSDYIKRLPDSIREKISKTGIRNIAVHAIAPTGSLQCISQCSAAIEPAFSIHYERKTNLGTAKEVQVHEVWHPAAKEYADKFGVSPNKLPEYFVGAHQIDPNFRIKLQSIVQKHIDQAISNTVNLPSNCEEKQIGDLYFEAWRAGLKGITVYREGSREGVLTSDNAKSGPAEINITQAPKRPTSLDGRVHLIKPNGKQFTVFVGLLKGRPYEVFVLDHGQAGVSDGMTGHIIKDAEDDASSGTTYYFESGALWVRRLNKFEDNEISLVTRLMSTALRHGTPLERIIEQVGKSKVPISNFARAIVRALGTYIKQEELVGKFKCRDCGSNEIKFEGSCYTCMSCGSSKCS